MAKEQTMEEIVQEDVRRVERHIAQTTEAIEAYKLNDTRLSRQHLRQMRKLLDQAFLDLLDDMSYLHDPDEDVCPGDGMTDGHR